MSKRPVEGKYAELIDGGFTHKFPEVDEDTLTISAFNSGGADIFYPSAKQFNLDLETEEVYMSYFWAGVEMAQHNHDLIERKLRSRGVIPKIGYVSKKNF
jgi:hypothetical protein